MAGDVARELRSAQGGAVFLSATGVTFSVNPEPCTGRGNRRVSEVPALARGILDGRREKRCRFDEVLDGSAATEPPTLACTRWDGFTVEA